MDCDLTLVLRNVVSNVLAAIKSVENGKAEIHLIYKKAVFFIQINNDFHGQLTIENNKLCTVYENKENHGYGIVNSKRVVEKYDGELCVEDKNNKFKTDMIVYEKT